MRALLTFLLLGLMSSLLHGQYYWTKAQRDEATANSVTGVGFAVRFEGNEGFDISNAIPFTPYHVLVPAHSVSGTTDLFLRYGTSIDYRDIIEQVDIVSIVVNEDYDPGAPLGTVTDMAIVEHTGFSSAVPLMELNRDTEMQLLGQTFDVVSPGRNGFHPENQLTIDTIFRPGQGFNEFQGGTSLLDDHRDDFWASQFNSDGSHWLLTDGGSGSCQIIDDKCAVMFTHIRGGNGPVALSVGIEIAHHIDWIDSVVNPEPSFSKFDLDKNSRIDFEDILLFDREVRNGSVFPDIEIEEFLNLAGVPLGDVNGDGATDFTDFLALSLSFGGEGGWENGSFDQDGAVLFPDFLALSSNFGRDLRSDTGGSAVSSVPEPATISLALFGILAGMKLRRRR